MRRAYFSDVTIYITIKPSPTLAYIIHDRELANDYQHLFGYRELELLMKEEKNKDDHGS